MFRTPTTLIIGAGASAEFGPPLGAALFEKIKLQALTINMVEETSPYIPQDKETIELRRVLKVLAKNGEASGIFERARELSKRKDNILYPSIDRFIRDNPEFSKFGKLLISFNLICSLYEYTHPTACWTRKARHKSFKNEDNKNWLAALGAHLRDGFANSDEFHEHYQNVPFNVISFNYENLFEEGLNGFLSQDSNFKDLTLLPSCRIKYCYGKIDNLPQETDSLYEEIIENAQSIKTIFEATDDNRDDIIEIINDSYAIYSFGFSWDEENIRFLGFEEAGEKPILAVNYDGNRLIHKRLRRYGIKNEASGSSASGMSINRAIEEEGIFEDSFADSINNKLKSLLKLP